MLYAVCTVGFCSWQQQHQQLWKRSLQKGSCLKAMQHKGKMTMATPITPNSLMLCRGDIYFKWIKVSTEIDKQINTIVMRINLRYFWNKKKKECVCGCVYYRCHSIFCVLLIWLIWLGVTVLYVRGGVWMRGSLSRLEQQQQKHWSQSSLHLGSCLNARQHMGRMTIAAPITPRSLMFVGVQVWIYVKWY